eukprot:2194850-Lingulodinium_polyedra.AAC.1
MNRAAGQPRRGQNANCARANRARTKGARTKRARTKRTSNPLRPAEAACAVFWGKGSKLGAASALIGEGAS